MNTSNTNAHTPGPWEIFPVKEVWRGHDVRGPHGETITHVQRGGSERADEQKANARLIASAPELLDAAEWASTILAGYLSANSQEERNYMYKDLQHAGKTLNAAIDKATAE